MKISELLTSDAIVLDACISTKEEAIELLASLHNETGKLIDKEKYIEAIYEREELSSTGIGEMIAIPHAQSQYVKQEGLAAIVVKEGVEFKSLDGKLAKLLFMIAVPKDGGSTHLEILAKLCQTLMEEKTKERLLQAKTNQEFIDILEGNIENQTQNNIKEREQYDILAVTACPTGIAHTYMAAKALEDNAKELGYTIKVETNGAGGIKNALTSKEIELTKCIIIAADKKVEMARFDGKTIIECPVAKGIHEAKSLLQDAYDIKGKVYHSNTSKQQDQTTSGIHSFYKHLMSGVSQTIPLLVIAGATLAILKLLGLSEQFTNSSSNQMMVLKQILERICYLTNYLALIILAGNIASSISDRPGFVITIIPVAMLGNNTLFIVAVIIGFLGGYIMLGLKKIFSYLPEALESIKPNVLLPLTGTLIMITITVIMIMVMGEGMNNYKIQLSQLLIMNPVIKILLAMVLGTMMSIDMGGPINKTAYTIGIFFVFQQNGEFMAAVMAGGIVPPLIVALSTTFMKQRFTIEQQKAGLKNYIMAASFVTEAAIPFMKSDKKTIYPACLIGSTIAAGLSMYFGCSSLLPHGGVFVLPFITEPFSYALAIFIGAVFATMVVKFLKKT